MERLELLVHLALLLVFVTLLSMPQFLKLINNIKIPFVIIVISLCFKGVVGERGEQGQPGPSGFQVQFHNKTNCERGLKLHFLN